MPATGAVSMTRRALAALAALALSLAAAGAGATDSPVRARTEAGWLAGRSDGAVDVYRAIPFAAAPIGPLRWAPPRPPPRWTGVRDALADGPACPQPINADRKPNAGGYVGPVSEDCLSLDVFAPHGARHAPVMVWIFGGGNVYGANAVPSNDGTSFARDGVVLVAVNYRLGALGFLAHPALTHAAPADEPLANYGTLDQIAALAWIKRNIKAFGGDPDNVTIMGESAGGMDVLTLMTTPAARGLFQKASVESGGGWETPVPLAAAEAAGLRLTEGLGLPADVSAEALRALPVEALVGAPGRYGPVIDGRLITEGYTQAFARGEQAPVPLIVGSNDYEASLLAPAGYAAYLATVPQASKAVYAGEAKDDQALAQALFTDRFGGAPARWIARRAAVRAPAWLYQFTYVRVDKRGKLPGANHTSEIPYVFDSQMAVPVYKLEIQAEDRAMATRVHSCWVAFAKTGAPDCAGGPPWPAYAPDSDRLMEFGLTPQVRAHWRKPQLDAAEASEGARLVGR
jgi:para-nitrobenzyl esterase